MDTVWWSGADLIHNNFININETITTNRYAHQVAEVHQKMHNQQPELVQNGDSLGSNSRPCISRPAPQKLNECGYEVDLSPAECRFFKHSR